jgi:hypothetical protein
MSDLYILVGHKPVEEPDVMKWGRWFNTADRRVGYTKHELFTVSTVFLGVDHNFSHHGPPTLFETMTFESGIQGVELEDGLFARYSSWEDAEMGHKAIVRKLTERALACTQGRSQK